MKRVELLRRLTEAGCKLKRHGKKHDWYYNPITGAAQAVPRHTELDDYTAKNILRELGA